ncbi:Nn.00g036070.m01.CDS01 [Neocucurbitaria sp. VM-36]
MSTPTFVPLTGHCTCKTITYALLAPPLVTNCCHCTYCQRETGSAFAINSLIEAYSFRITSPTQPVLTGIPSLSSPAGDKHLVAHCPKCTTALYAYYGGNRSWVFVKVGTMDDGSRARVQPDAHIFTRTAVPWVDLRSEEERGVRVFDEYYPREEVWSEESLRRREALLKWVEEKEKRGEEVGIEKAA